MNHSGKRGFTLVEVMVTLILLAFGMLASVVGIMKALDHSLLNEMRNDAIKIAQEQEEAARNMPYQNLQNISTAIPQTIWRQVRKQPVLYKVKFTRTSVGSGSLLGIALVQFDVSWSFKNTNYSCVLQTLVRQKQ
jgi:prepilin-type N-terminal cleavage/methylation domain-containing protein